MCFSPVFFCLFILFFVCLFTEANICLAVSKGYISGLLELYEEWHSKDTHHTAIEICHALLHCLHKVTKSTAGSQAFMSLGGINLLYRTSQVMQIECDAQSAKVDVADIVSNI